MTYHWWRSTASTYTLVTARRALELDRIGECVMRTESRRPPRLTRPGKLRVIEPHRFVNRTSKH